jgi:hypothetical protein
MVRGNGARLDAQIGWRSSLLGNDARFETM